VIAKSNYLKLFIKNRSKDEISAFGTILAILFGQLIFTGKYIIAKASPHGNSSSGVIQIMDSERKVKVCIFGPSKMQNEMMARCLEEPLGLDCKWYTESDLPPILNETNDHISLILSDCINTKNVEVWTKNGFSHHLNNPRIFVALFNFTRGNGVEKEVAMRGVKGVFYKNDTIDIFTRGIKAMLKGELWFSRKALNKCVLDARNSNMITSNNAYSPLTPREKEILTMITSGATNATIAGDLCISPHTVKCHIYNIYQKIEVSNRFQAALWAAKNF